MTNAEGESKLLSVQCPWTLANAVGILCEDRI